MAHIVGNISLDGSVYSMYDIAKYEKIGKEKIESLMSECLKKAMLACNGKSATDITAFFNAYGVNDYNINAFLSHGHLRPFAFAIRLRSERCYKGKNEVNYMMFCVTKKVYAEWRRNKIPYSNDVQPNMSEYGVSEISKRSVTLRKCPELSHFEKVATSLGFKMSEAVMLALNEYMKLHADVFGEVPKSEIDENKVRENKMKRIYAYIDPEVTSAVFKAIQRYNMINFPHIKFSEFVEAALKEKLDRIPVQYTDPQLFKEMQALKKAEEEAFKQSDS